MCGRFSLHLTDLSQVGETFGVSRSGIEVWEPRFNVAPSQAAAVITGEAERRLALMAWGFVPHFAKAPPKNRPINARVETVASRPIFRDAFAHRRCLVPATGYFEWQVDPASGHKQPFWIHPREAGALLYMAGLWSPRNDGTLDSETFAVVTTAAAGHVREIHDRMPLTLPLAEAKQWLERGPVTAPFLDEAIAKHEPDALDARAVTQLVNSPKNDVIECLSAAGEAPRIDGLETLQLPLFGPDVGRTRR